MTLRRLARSNNSLLTHAPLIQVLIRHHLFVQHAKHNQLVFMHQVVEDMAPMRKAVYARADLRPVLAEGGRFGEKL